MPWLEGVEQDRLYRPLPLRQNERPGELTLCLEGASQSDEFFPLAWRPLRLPAAAATSSPCKTLIYPRAQQDPLPPDGEVSSLLRPQRIVVEVGDDNLRKMEPSADPENRLRAGLVAVSQAM